MQDIKSLRARLASEKQALEQTQERISAAHGQIEALKQEIEELKARSEKLEKRVTLLRQYIDLVESGGGEDEADLADLASALGGGSEPAPAAKEEEEPETTDFDDMELADEGAGLGSVGAIPTPPPEPARNSRPLSFEEDVDERRLSNELLPRAGSTEEALLLLMAQQRKGLTPKAIVNTFRRLEYSPDVPSTADAIAQQLEQQPLFFARAGKGDRFVLTEEGRAEAENLLQQLAL